MSMWKKYDRWSLLDNFCWYDVDSLILGYMRHAYVSSFPRTVPEALRSHSHSPERHAGVSGA
jgi:hypothetical protein